MKSGLLKRRRAVFEIEEGKVEKLYEIENVILD